VRAIAPISRTDPNHGRATPNNHAAQRGNRHRDAPNGKQVRHNPKCAVAAQNRDPDSLISDPVVGFAPPLMQRGLLS